MSSGWGCPHEVEGNCSKVNMERCDPGMKGCVLAGRFTFSEEAKNRREGPKQRSWERDRERATHDDEK